MYFGSHVTISALEDILNGEWVVVSRGFAQDKAESS